jgi:hypothetical protein
MTLAGLLLYYFHISTAFTITQDVVEGLQAPQTGSGWGLLIVSFVLTILYLPLSTIAVHALVWSEDFWVVANPYVNATSNPPEVPPLGPTSEFRPPLDFCYTTTMKLTEVNAAPAIVIMAAFVFAFVRLQCLTMARSTNLTASLDDDMVPNSFTQSDTSLCANRGSLHRARQKTKCE